MTPHPPANDCKQTTWPRELRGCLLFPSYLTDVVIAWVGVVVVEVAALASSGGGGRSQFRSARLRRSTRRPRVVHDRVSPTPAAGFRPHLITKKKTVHAFAPGHPGAGFDSLEVPTLPAGTVLFSWEACGVFLGWIAYCTMLHLVLPGMRREGVVLADKTRLTYKLNGMRCLLVTMALVGVGPARCCSSRHRMPFNPSQILLALS